MKKANIILIVLIAVLVVFLGIGIYFIVIKDSNSTQTNPPVNNEPIEEPNDSGVETIPNESDANYEEHCLNDLCIKIDEFNIVEDYGGFSLTITNKGTDTIPASFKNIIFSTPDGEVKLFFYHAELNSGQSIETEVTFENKSLIEATDYKLEEPSAVEIMEYYSNMTN